MVYTLLSGPMVYTLFPCFPKKMVYTIAFFCSVTSGSGNRPRKEGCHGGGGVYSFSQALLNGFNEDKEVTASPLVKIRRLGLEPLETPFFLGQSSLIALLSTSFNKEVESKVSINLTVCKLGAL